MRNRRDRGTVYRAGAASADRDAAPVSPRSSSSTVTYPGSEVFQVVEDFGIGPVLGADEFAADDPVSVDDVGFGRPRCVEGIAGLVVEIDDGGDAGDVVVDQVLAVVGLGGVEGDGDDSDVGHVALELDEGGELLCTGRAPAGPEIEDDDLALFFVLAEGHGLSAVVDGDFGGAFADLSGVGGAIAGKQAAGNRQQATEQETADSVQRIASVARLVRAADHIPIIGPWKTRR